MNIARKAAMISLGCVTWLGAQAQSNVCLSGASSNKLACILPFTTGAANAGNGSVNQAAVFNGPIGVQISQLPVAASAPGAIVLFSKGNPAPFDNLGPILLDRPDSVGKGTLVLGISYQSFNFNHLDGIGIGAIPFEYAEQSVTGNTVTQTNYFQQTVHASIRYDQYVALASYGLPKKFDLSVVVPFARVSIGTYNLNSSVYQVTTGDTLNFVSSVPTKGTPGAAAGVGDVVANIKHELWSGGGDGRTSIATGMAFRFPTGDALNYLGSGSYGINLYGLASYKAKVSPHVKMAYQWNTNSVLLNLSGSGANQRLPGGAQYGVGFDIGVTPQMTFSADILADEFINSPSISPATLTIPVTSLGTVATANAPIPSCPSSTGSGITPLSTASCTLNTINTSNATYTTANLSMGLKFKPTKKLIFYGNVLIQLNDVGLRSDASPSVGLSYRFF
jgi:hypothetical protein